MYGSKWVPVLLLVIAFDQHFVHLYIANLSLFDQADVLGQSVHSDHYDDRNHSQTNDAFQRFRRQEDSDGM